MKIPAIRQLPSGAWFCQLRLDGQSISITDDDPDVVTAKAYAYKAGVLKARKTPQDITVGKAIENYIESRRNVISPSTLRGYQTIQRTRFIELQKLKLSALSQSVMQREVGKESSICSAKTVKNAYLFIVSALVSSGGERYDVRLPQVPPAHKEYLTPEQIPIILEAARGTTFEIPILLGLWSCRRSEIFGLEWSNIDLEKRVISIAKALVTGENNQLIEKHMPKNKSSVRTIPICEQLYKALILIPEDKRIGRVINAHPNSLYKSVNTLCATNGLPQIGVHGLRHSFASLAYHLNVPAKVAMKIGGWENDDVMNRIYTHIADADISSAASDLMCYFDTHKPTPEPVIANDNANDN